MPSPVFAGSAKQSKSEESGNGSARQNGVAGVELDDDTSGKRVNQLTETGEANKGSYDLVDDNGDCDENVRSNNLVDENRGFPACVGQYSLRRFAHARESLGVAVWSEGAGGPAPAPLRPRDFLLDIINVSGF
jgi:hypothetical protein